MNRMIAAGLTWALLLAASAALAGEIEWRSDFREAWKEAQGQRRPVLLYFTVDSCGYCRKMERETWRDQMVVESVAKDYVPIKIDGSDQSDLVERLGVAAFPTTWIIVPGNEDDDIQVLTGYLAPTKMRQALESGLERQRADRPR
jgi:thiol:disulfide interchange protein